MDYGLIKLRLANGTEMTVRGDVTENPANISIEPVVNQDGSVDGIVTPTGYGGKFTLTARDASGAPVDANALLRLGVTSLTLISESEKTLRSYSGVLIHGAPEVDLMNGGLTGFMFTARGRQVSAI